MDRARQEESYKTLFERDTVRPFVASYQKVTDTQLSLHVQSGDDAAAGEAAASPPVLHQISQTEYKNSYDDQQAHTTRQSSECIAEGHCSALVPACVLCLTKSSAAPACFFCLFAQSPHFHLE